VVDNYNFILEINISYCQSALVNHKGKPKVAIDYNALFVRMVKKYNKHHKDNPLPHITPHTLRHTFCTRLASKNMNPKDLQYIKKLLCPSITNGSAFGRFFITR